MRPGACRRGRKMAASQRTQAEGGPGQGREVPARAGRHIGLLGVCPRRDGQKGGRRVRRRAGRPGREKLRGVVGRLRKAAADGACVRKGRHGRIQAGVPQHVPRRGVRRGRPGAVLVRPGRRIPRVRRGRLPRPLRDGLRQGARPPANVADSQHRPAFKQGLDTVRLQVVLLQPLPEAARGQAGRQGPRDTPGQLPVQHRDTDAPRQKAPRPPRGGQGLRQQLRRPAKARDFEDAGLPRIDVRARADGQRRRRRPQFRRDRGPPGRERALGPRAPDQVPVPRRGEVEARLQKNR